MPTPTPEPTAKPEIAYEVTFYGESCDVTTPEELPAEEQAELWSRQELYRAMSTVNGGRALESDLFEGLRRQHVAARAA